jgi:hypothetical protein
LCTLPKSKREIFTGFVRRQAASRWAGLARSACQLIQSENGSSGLINISENKIALKNKSNFIF